MPLPWKKARVGRISRLVADLQSPKRGGSLVVETGFPTSLIDLFVKNRDRLKTTSRRRRSRASDPVPPPPAQPQPHVEVPQRPPEYVQPVEAQARSEIGSVKCEVEDTDGIDDRSSVAAAAAGEVEVRAGGPSGRGVAMAVLKMSVVVILALGTKKLAVGITMSTFLLLFLEYAAKLVVRFLTPCSDAQITINSLIQKLFPFPVTKQTAPTPLDDLTSRTLSNASDEEIRIAESQFLFLPPMEETHEILEEIQMVRPKIDMPPRDRGWEHMEAEEGEGDKEKEEEQVTHALGLKHIHGRRARLKSKIKKYIPKNMRGRKWGNGGKEKGRCSDSGSEGSGYTGGDKACSFEEEVEEERGGGVEEPDDEDKSLRSPPLEEEEEKWSEVQDMDCASCSSEIPSQKNVVKADVVEEKQEKEEEALVRNSGYLVFCLIVLAGLLGGRLLALLLTLTWCLMLKLFRKKLTLLT